MQRYTGTCSLNRPTKLENAVKGRQTVFWQIKEARAIVLEAERGILPALIPQLQSSSVVRRRGAAGVMR
jgi:hypothetical protein